MTNGQYLVYATLSAQLKNLRAFADRFSVTVSGRDNFFHRPRAVVESDQKATFLIPEGGYLTVAVVIKFPNFVHPSTMACLSSPVITNACCHRRCRVHQSSKVLAYIRLHMLS